MVVTSPTDTAVCGDAASDSTKQKEAKLETLIAEGKRAYIVNDLAVANENLSKAAELSVELYGQFDKKSFEPHFYYGKTLLAMSREEEGIFTKAIRKENDDEESSEDGEPDEGGNDLSGEDSEADTNKEEKTIEEHADKQGNVKVDGDEHIGNGHSAAIQGEEEANGEGEKCVKQGDNGEEEDGAARVKGDAAMDVVEIAEDEGEQPKEKETKPEDAAKNGEQKNAPEAEPKEATVGDELEVVEKESAMSTDVEEGNEKTSDDIGNFQLAWEVLEVAREICDKNVDEGDEWKVKKTEVLLALGECSTNDGNYKQAFDDLQVCVELQKALFAPHDRRIAETYFHMALAHSLNNEFALAAADFGDSKRVLLSRLAHLKEELEKAEDKEALEKEVTEIQELLPIIEAKIEDANESAKNVAQVEKVTDAEAPKQPKCEGSVGEGNQAGDVTTIHVRKKGVKRTVAENGKAEHEDETNVKRPKPDEGDTIGEGTRVITTDVSMESGEQHTNAETVKTVATAESEDLKTEAEESGGPKTLTTAESDCPHTEPSALDVA